jgi:hypothetical protein
MDIFKIFEKFINPESEEEKARKIIKKVVYHIKKIEEEIEKELKD